MGLRKLVDMLDHKYVEFIFSNNDRFKIDFDGSKKPIRKWFEQKIIGKFIIKN